jgi:hypothetical protein
MRKTLYLWMTVALCCLGSACKTSQHTQDRWTNRINHWVPAGTSQDDARRIMVQHGFDVLIDNPTEMSFHKSTAFHEIGVGLSFTNGKIRTNGIDTTINVPVHF